MAMSEAVERSPSGEARGGRRALVRLDGQPVGTFVETERGTRFTYDPDWLQRPNAVPISLALPLASEPYDWPGLHPVFENLLPEGWLLGIATTSHDPNQTTTAIVSDFGEMPPPWPLPASLRPPWRAISTGLPI